MKDIKALYLDAKARGTPSSIASYTEAIQELFETNPYGYYSEAEYIISSSIGLATFRPFVEKWGLPILAYDKVMGILESCVKKAEAQHQDTSSYQDAIDFLTEFRSTYPHCFAMVESFKYIPGNEVHGEIENIAEQFIEKYYSVNDKGVQGRRIVSMASYLEYGPMAGPDLMITANKYGSKDLYTVFEYVHSATGQSPTGKMLDLAGVNQWLTECAKDFQSDHVNGFVERVRNDTLEHYVAELKQKQDQLFREAAIVGSDDAAVVYTEKDMYHIQELINILEAVMVEDGVDHKAIYEQVLSAYEMLAGFIGEAGEVIAEEVADSVIPNLPSATEAAPWMANTMNKKTGDMPIYISRNHNLGYGEDLGGKSSDDPDRDPTLDDFKLPNRDTEPDDDDNDEPAEEPTSTGSTEPGAGGNNYYYYTYNNSLNQNKDSFNKDMSRHDDHSVTRKTDDHSQGKHINSDNRTTHEDDEDPEYQALESAKDFSDFKKAPDEEEKKHSKEIVEEMVNFQNRFESVQLDTEWTGRPMMDDMKAISSTLKESCGVNPPKEQNPFDLSIHAISRPFMEVGVYPVFLEGFILISEGVKQDWGKECKLFNQMFGHDLNKLGDINSPPKKITLNIGGKKMQFSTARGYSQSTGRRVDRYAQVPTSIHNFNVNRNDFVEDKIGIAKGVLHQLKMMDRNFKSGTTIEQAMKIYKLAPDRIIFKQCGEIGITFMTNLSSKGIGLNIEPDLTVHDGEETIAYESASTVAMDPEDMKPQSDHPIRDALMDFDRKTTKAQQAAKKKVQEVQQTGKAFMKPVQRSADWITKMVHEWRDLDENKAKEKLADPHARGTLFTTIGNAIKVGSLAKAGLLLNPVFLVLSATKGINHNKNQTRLRNEILGELDAEMAIIDEKIHQADQEKKYKEKYRLMRFKKELEKKKLRVGGGKKISRVL